MRHTPGPWSVSDHSIVAEHHCIAVIEDDGDYAAPWEEREANAPILAAALDLLEACEAAEAVLTKVVPLDGDPDWIDGRLLPSIRAAIAKAKPAHPTPPA